MINNDKDEDLRYKIIDFIDIIGTHEFSAEFVKEISNGFLISGGYDAKLNIYNESFNQIIELKDFNDCPYSINEISKNENKNIYNIIVSCRLEIYFIELDLKDFKFNISKKILPYISNIICLEIKKNNYIISGETGAYYFSNLDRQQNKFNPIKILERPYKNGIKLSKNIIALASNKVLANGKDEIIFYSSSSKKIIKTINDYSFITSVNGLCLMNINESKRILLCACKKYFSSQKNGILLINPQIHNEDITEPFYDTGEFEVFCFCQLNLKNNGTYNDLYSKYFLVGGFDIEKRQGMIKCFQLICNENIFETKIKYILDIVIEEKKNFQGFEKPINCIIQSKKKGNIIASSYDGNIFLFTSPNLDFFAQ